MEIVDRFLDTLQNIINSNSIQIDDFEYKKNEKLKIKNILYNHNILENEITLDSLISFNDEEIKEIFACLDNNKKDILYKTYNVYKPLFEMYNKIKNKYNGEFEAPQYNEASKWLNDIVEKVNHYLKDNQTANNEYINSLKEENVRLNKYYNLFNGNNLIHPINDLKDFSNLLETLNFNYKEKYEIKKFIGISHIKLLSEEYNNSMNEELNKYKVVMKSKKEKYQKAYKKIQKETNLDFDTVNTLDLSNKYKIGEYEIRQALTVIFIEKILEQIKNEEITINNAILKLEDILKFSRGTESDINNQEELSIESTEETVLNKEVETEKQEIKETSNEQSIEATIKEEQVITKDEKVINEAVNILLNEKELVNDINEDEFSRYLAESFNNNSKESIKYQIVSILLAMHAELEKYNNAKDIENVKNAVISNIKEYIEAYKTLKHRLNS